MVSACSRLRNHKNHRFHPKTVVFTLKKLGAIFCDAYFCSIGKRRLDELMKGETA